MNVPLLRPLRFLLQDRAAFDLRSTLIPETVPYSTGQSFPNTRGGLWASKPGWWAEPLAIGVCAQEALSSHARRLPHDTLPRGAQARRGSQSHSQCQQQPSGSMTCTGCRPLEQVGMGGGLHSTSTISTTLSYLQMAHVQLHNNHLSFSCSIEGVTQAVLRARAPGSSHLCSEAGAAGRDPAPATPSTQRPQKTSLHWGWCGSDAGSPTGLRTQTQTSW